MDIKRVGVTLLWLVAALFALVGMCSGGRRR